MVEEAVGCARNMSCSDDSGAVWLEKSGMKTLCNLYEILCKRWGATQMAGQGPRLLKSLEIVGNMEAWRVSARKSYIHGLVSPEDERNEVRNLAVEIFGQRECTDLRDAIYGLLSISPLLAFVIPDYTLSTAEVYIAAAKAIISIRQDLDIFSRVQRSTAKPAWMSRREKGLPSWVPDWSSKMEYEDILSMTLDDKSFNASGDNTLPSKALSKHNEQILLDGVFWDQIAHTSQLYWAGHSGTGFSGDENAGPGLRDFMYKLAGSERGLRGWSAISTKTGHMGLMLGDGNVGDMIYVAYGSRVPLVLRPFGDQSESKFSLVGTAYCEVLMYGEAVATMRLKYFATDKGEPSSWIGKSLSKWRAGRKKVRKVLVKELFEEEICLM